MFRIIYSSSACDPFSEQELVQLLETSRRNNLAADITGMLLYQNGHFMQTLEGPDLAVQNLIEKIQADPRHRNFTILMQGPLLERAFPSWSMGFKKITPGTPIDVPGYLDSGDFSLMTSQFVRNPPRSLALLFPFTQAP